MLQKISTYTDNSFQHLLILYKEKGKWDYWKNLIHFIFFASLARSLLVGYFDIYLIPFQYYGRQKDVKTTLCIFKQKTLFGRLSNAIRTLSTSELNEKKQKTLCTNWGQKSLVQKNKRRKTYEYYYIKNYQDTVESR